VRWIGGLAAALVLGLVLGYIVHDQVTGTPTTTVVHIVTTAPPPQPTHDLSIVVQGANGGCLRQSLAGHTFALRRPGDGLSEGEVLALAGSADMSQDGCRYTSHFSIHPRLGFFVVSDEGGYHDWGPFDSNNLAGAADRSSARIRAG
jgi:hypothetical protein